MSERRRARIPILLLISVICLAAAFARWFWPRGPERVILIVVDTLRRDHISAYGGVIDTPHIDALVSRGRRYDQALASFHQTTMSMASLFTGRTPSIESTDPATPLTWNGQTWCGLSRFAREADDTCLPTRVPTLAETLRDAGYWTIGIASNALLFEPAGYARGFDDWIEVGTSGKGIKKIATEAAARQRSASHVRAATSAALTRRPRDRFFLYVHLMDVHDYRLLGESYAQSVRRTDAVVGELLASLDAGGYTKHASIILTSDHGELLGGKHPVRRYRKKGHFGNPSFEPVLAVPLIVAPAPDLAPDTPLRGDDVFRLILEIARVKPPEIPPSPLRAGELVLGENRWTTYRADGFKSVRSRDEKQYHLFDLVADPEESVDVQAEHPEIAAAQRARIRELQGELSNRGPTNPELTDEDRERLRVLGYIE